MPSAVTCSGSHIARSYQVAFFLLRSAVQLSRRKTQGCGLARNPMQNEYARDQTSRQGD